jgi:hypothetical protein
MKGGALMLRSWSWLRLVLVSAATMAMASAGHAGDAVAKVSGGGTATFDFVEGLQSQFAIGSTVYDDGSAKGHFVCMIVGVVAISGDVTDGSVNPDGSVTVSGDAHGIDHTFGGPFGECPFTVTFWRGGPNVGQFLYSDCVVPPPGDAETVSKGRIKIRYR